MKTISSRFLKAAVAMLLIVLMIFGSTVSSFAAVVDKADTGGNHSGGYIYFIKPSTWTNAAFIVGHSSWFQTYKMTQLSGNLYYLNLRTAAGGNWDGWSGWGFVDSNSTTNGGTNVNTKYKTYTHYTGLHTSYALKNNSTYVIAGGSSNDAAISPSYQSGGYSALNSTTQTVYSYSTTAGGSTYTADAAAASTLSVKTQQLTGNGSIGRATTTSKTDSASSANRKAAQGSAVTVTAAAADGYTFKGWFSSDTSTTALSTATSYTYNAGTGDTSVYAKFEKTPKYSVTYNANGGTGAPAASTNLTAGSSHTVSSTVPKYTGYNFKSWNTAANGSGASYTAGQTITVNSDIILYAQWAEVHTITYDADGGSGAPANGSAEDGTDYDIPDTVPTKADHNFTGWKDQNDTTYAAGDTISAVSSDMTLTAQWELASVCSPVMAGLTLEINETGKVTATTNDFCTGDKTFDYDLVDGDEFIILNDDQTVTPKKPGTAHVKATCACGKEVTCAVTVNEPVLDINPEEVALLIGQSMTEAFKASANVGNPTVTFKSKDAGIATVTNGKATAVAEGNVDIEASLKFNDYYTATICAKVSVSVPTITADPTSVALEFGEGATATSSTVTVETNAAAGNSTGDDVTVTSAKTSVATATISGSTITITATGVGSTTVTAKFHDAEVSIPVTVTKYDPYVYLYITNNHNFSNLYIYSWQKANNDNNVTPVETKMIYIGDNGDSTPHKVYAYKFLKTNKPDNFIITKTGNWTGNWQTADIPVSWTDTDHRAFYFSSSNKGTGMGDWTKDCMIVRPTVSVADVVVPVGGTETATATVENGGKVLWKSQGTSIATIADVDTQTSTVTGVTPGETTITARAFVDTANSSIKTLPTNYKTDTACWDFISTEATANVKVGSVNYDIAVNAETGGTASITVAGKDEGNAVKIAHGTEYTLTADANEGYRFIGWYNGDDEVSTEASYTTTAKAAVDYTAKFVKTYKVTVNLTEGIELVKLNNVASAEGFKNIEVDAGASITVYASPAEGYAFLNWTTEDITLANPTAAQITITNIQSDLTLTANAIATTSASVNVQTNKYFDTYGGNVTINGENVASKQCLPGEIATFEATPNTNYYFAGWFEDANFTRRIDDDDNVYEVTMGDEPVQVHALFVKQFYLTSSSNERLAEFVYNIAENSYSVTTDFTDHLTITSNDNKDVTDTDVQVVNGNHVGCTVVGHYTSYQVKPDTENYDIESPVTYTLTPDLKSDGTADGTYTMNIALSDAEKVEISLNGTKIAEKAIGSTFTYEITPPDGQYLSGATITPNTPFEIVDGKIKFTVPNTNVNIVPAFANYSYVEFTNTTGLAITGLKGGYKAGEEVIITVAPASEQVSIINIEADNEAAVITNNNAEWTITIASMPAETYITITPSVDAKFMMDYGMYAIGNYGSGYTTYGTVAMAIGDTALAKGGYADKTETVTYTATPNANFIFDGWYSTATCEVGSLLSRNTSYDVTPTKDTTVYALFVPKHYLAPDQAKVATNFEMTYDPETRTFHYTSSDIAKDAWFRVSNNKTTSAWTDSNSYAKFDSSFNVTFNANAYMVTVGWGTKCYALTSDSTAEYPYEIIVEIHGNSSIDVSCKANKIGNSVYLSSGRLDLPGSYNASVFETEFEFTHIEKSANPAVSEVKNENEIREKYRRLNVPEAQTVSFEVQITGNRAADYEVDTFVVYHINTESYTIITPTTLGNNKYSGSVYVDGPCYIVPIYFLTEKYATDNNLAEIDIYFDATAIKDQAWGPFVACYAWGSNNTEYNGGWSGQMMIPTEDGLSFYTMITVPKATAENPPSVPQGVTFNNYLQSTVPGSNAGIFGITSTQYQCYDYREPITLYELGYEVITFVAKDSNDGYHGDHANGVTSNPISKDVDIFEKYDFEYLYSRDGVTPMDLTGQEILNAPELSDTNKADYYVVNEGDLRYYKDSHGYQGDPSYEGKWTVEWWVFDSEGNYKTNIISDAFYNDIANGDGTTYLQNALGLTKEQAAGKSIAISYEHENKYSVEGATHQISYDGQWYGNMLDHTVTGNVLVGLLGADNKTYTIDDDNVADYGEGYLVDENGEKHASLEITMDLGEASLSAVRKDGYRFIGWHTLQPNGTYKLISNAYDYTTYINNNTTYYAIFKQIQSGEVVINHAVYKNTDPAIPDHGGVSEMSIEVYNKNGLLVSSTTCTARSTTSSDVSTASVRFSSSFNKSLYSSILFIIRTPPLQVLTSTISKLFFVLLQPFPVVSSEALPLLLMYTLKNIEE